MNIKFANSILIDTDSYKVSMWKQYPPNTKYVYSYITSRGGHYPKVMFLLLQAFIKDRLMTPITQEEIDFADKFWTAHGEPFNRAGWQYILDVHKGILPLEIRSIDEGLVVDTKLVLATIVNTDPECYWLTTWVETPALRAVWYGTTVATQSLYIRNIIRGYLEKSGDVAGLNFKLHDFGSRGVSSKESAMLGGMSHLATGATGTDTAISILAAAEYYGADIFNTAWSIPAAEHSTITSWGRGREALAYENMITQFSKPGSIYAVVSDSYDIYNAIDLWGNLKDKILQGGGTLVVRPDSGDPIEVLPRLFKKLEKYFGVSVNDKHFKVLNNVRVIWGDGINERSIQSILRVLVDVMGYSADNIAFGMGGALLQIVNRDTQEFAMKCSAAFVDGGWIDVFKDPVTDKGKVSAKGRFKVVIDANGTLVNAPWDSVEPNQLKLRYVDGNLLNQTTFTEVQERANRV